MSKVLVRCSTIDILDQQFKARRSVGGRAPNSLVLDPGYLHDSYYVSPPGGEYDSQLNSVVQYDGAMIARTCLLFVAS